MGQNARSIIEGLRLEAERFKATASVNAQSAIGAEGARHTKKWTATVASQAQIDVKNLLRDDDLVNLISVRSEEFNRLIRNLSNDVLDRIERQTLGAIFEGRGQADIAKSLQEIDGIGRNRARLIARDQASKLNGAMNQFRQEQAGITHYKWRTILDGRERPSHNANNNKVFSWAAPPKSTGHPGHDINCRCRALAVITDEPEALADLPDEPLSDFFEANLPAIREVAQTPKQPVFGFQPSQIAERLAMTRELQANVSAVTKAFTEVDAERLVIELYGFKPSDDDLRNLLTGLQKLTASRRTILIEAAKARLALIEGQLSHAGVDAGGMLFEGAAQETIAAKRLKIDGFAAVPQAEVSAQLRIAERFSDLERKHFDTYSEYGYRIINRYARDGVISEIKAGKLVPAANPQAVAGMVERIAQTIQSRTYANVLPNDTVLYRGVGTTHIGNGILTPGYTWRDATFASASRDLKAATEFYDAGKNPVMMVIYSGGKRGLPIERIAQFAYEKEIILPAGTTFRVRSVEYGVKRGLLDKARTYVHVDIVSQTEEMRLGSLRQSGKSGQEPSKAFFRAGNVSAKPLDEAAAQARREVLDEGRKSGYEVATAYDANGRSLGVWSSGDADRVNLPIAELRNPRQAITVHHTHPNSTSFSKADYAAFDSNPGMSRLYAHGHDGSDYMVERVSTRNIGAVSERAYDAARSEIIELMLAGGDDVALELLMPHAMGQALGRAGVVNYRARLSKGLQEMADMNSALVKQLSDAIFAAIR